HIFKNTHFNFLRWRWHALVVSWVIILAGIFVLATKGIQKGVEFAGGTVVITEFDRPTSVQQVREALDRNFPGGGTYAVVLAFGFQFSFGVGAVVATIHDLLVTLAFLAFFRYDMSLNVIAAILTMTGFSTNDTIVIFDRVRENLRSMRRDSMFDVINASVNQTLGRTVITSGTALLTSLALFFFGGEVLHGFAFTMVVGIVTGTYSSVFIAAAIVSLWRGSAPTRAAAHAPAPTAAAAAQQPARRSKPQR